MENIEKFGSLLHGVDNMQKTFLDGLDHLDSKRKVLFDEACKSFGIKVSSFEDMLFALINVFVRLKECTSISSFVLTIHSFFKDVEGTSYSKFTRKYLDYVLLAMFATFGVQGVYHFNSKHRESSKFSRVQALDSGSEFKFRSVLDNIKSMLRHKDMLISSDFIAKIGSFASLIICTPLFVRMGVDTTWFGFSNIFDKDLKKRYKAKHIGALSLEIVESAVYICDRVLHYHDTGDVSAIFIEDKEVAEFEEMYNKLVHYSDKFSIMANVGWSIDDYLREVDLCIEKGKKLMNFFSNDKFKLASLKSQQLSLGRCKMRAMDKLAVQTEREAPIGLCLYGPPEVGKSALIDKLMHCMYENSKYIKGTGRSYDPKMKYILNEDDEYFSEFKISHEVCVIDDVDQFRDEYNLQKKGGGLAKAIYLVNPIPYVTNQAHLEDKGMIPFLCKYVVATTNTYDAGIGKVFQKHGGAYRRFIFIEVSVKPEYQKPDSTALKGDLTVGGHENHELHDFKIRQYIPHGKVSKPVYYDKDTGEMVARRDVPFMTFEEVSVYMLNNVQRPFYSQSDHTKKSVDDFLSKGFCETCERVGAFCSCSLAQSDGYLYTSKRNHMYDVYDVHDFREARSGAISGFFESLCSIYVVWATLMLFLWYTCLSAILRTTGKHNHYCARKVLYYVKKIPNRFQMPFWVSWIPNCILVYFVSEYWLQYSNDLSLRIYRASLVSYDYARQLSKQRTKWGVAGMLSALAAVAYVHSMSTSISQSDGSETVHDEENNANSDVKNVWKTNCQDMVRVSGPPSTITKEDLTRIVTANTGRLIYYTKNKNGVDIDVHSVVFLGVCGNTSFVPHHFFESMAPLLPLKVTIVRDDGKGISKNRQIIVDHTNFSVFTKDDLIIFRHSSLMLFRDIRPYMYFEPMLGKYNGQIITRENDGSVTTRNFKALQYQKIYYVFKVEDIAPKVGYGYRANYVDKNTVNGDCGSPYIVETQNGYVIPCMHIAGGHSPSHVVGVPVHKFREDNRIDPHSYDGVDLNDQYVTDQDLSVEPKQHSKCPLKEIKGAGIVYGTLNTHRRKNKSSVCNTLMCKEVLDHYDLKEPKHTSPMAIKSREAAKVNLEPMFDKPTFPQHLVYRAEDAIVEWYTRSINDSGIDMPRGPLDLLSSINGIDGIAYMERMPVKTSGGFAHKGSKKKYLKELPGTDEHDVCYTFDDPIYVEYVKMVNNYSQGRRSNVVWDFNFKDEPVTHEKVEKNKCRVFNSGPMAFIALERQYFLWCIPFFSGKHRHRFGMAIGANCYSSDWDVLYSYITQHGKDKMIAGDYSKFDKRMSSQVMLSAFNVLIRLMKRAGWSDYDIRIAKGIATDICYPLSNAFGTIIETDGSNPSGHSLTTVINGIVNIMYIMMASMEIEDNLQIKEIDYNHFPNYCSILTYGDDNVMSSCKGWLNHVSISTYLAKYGVVYTMADKKSKSVPFIHIDDVEFLKRKFVEHVHANGAIACPLAEDSIIKMLTVVVKSKTITFDQQCSEVILAANREYFQYGKQICDAKKHFLDTLIMKYHLHGFLPDGILYTYDQLYDRIYSPGCSIKSEEVDLATHGVQDQSSDDNVEEA